MRKDQIVCQPLSAAAHTPAVQVVPRKGHTGLKVSAQLPQSPPTLLTAAVAVAGARRGRGRIGGRGMCRRHAPQQVRQLLAHLVQSQLLLLGQQLLQAQAERVPGVGGGGSGRGVAACGQARARAASLGAVAARAHGGARAAGSNDSGSVRGVQCHTRRRALTSRKVGNHLGKQGRPLGEAAAARERVAEPHDGAGRVQLAEGLQEGHAVMAVLACADGGVHQQGCGAVGNSLAARGRTPAAGTHARWMHGGMLTCATTREGSLLRA